MHAVGTDAASLTAQSERMLRANLDALRTILPKTAKLMDASGGMPDIEAAVGRDGATTYTWTDHFGQRKWLGDTTMPSVSEAALVEQFDVGGGNVVISGIGHGTAIHQLTKSLRAHQAIFVIEPDAWRAHAAFRLHPFGDAIRSRRLLLFVGRDAWDHLIEHLVEFPGFLVPDRTLAWPWYSRGDVRVLTDRISAMQSHVNERRNESMTTEACPTVSKTLRVFIGSNATDPQSHRWAQYLAQAVRDADGDALCCVPDAPSLMNPLAIDRHITRLQPTATILIDSVPSQLAFRVPKGPACVVVTHARRLSDEFLFQVPKQSPLFVRTEAQRQQAIGSGMDSDRVAIIRPGAPRVHADADTTSTGKCRLVVLADFHGIDPEDVGLHLGSHKRLWRAAMEWISKHTNSYHDGLAPDALACAEAALDLRIQSEDVRAGLIDRIRSTLGPQIVTESILIALASSDVTLELRGRGWERHETLGEYSASRVTDAAAPDMSESREALLWTDTAACADDRVMAWLAMHRPVFLRLADGRQKQNAAQVSEWPNLVDVNEHVSVFSTVDELKEAVNGFAADAAGVARRARAAAEHVQAHHSWSRRLNEILASCNIASESLEN